MTLREWVRSHIRDDAKHAELDAREERTNAQVEGLRTERMRNGFGEMFGSAGLGGSLPAPAGHHKKGKKR